MTLIVIMRNFIEYYKKLSMIMKNSYYTYESAKDMIMSSDDFIKLNQSNKRTLYLNEAFEDMGKNNKHDFINQIKLFIQTFDSPGTWTCHYVRRSSNKIYFLFESVHGSINFHRPTIAHDVDAWDKSK